jgi:hypothetical protein
MEQNEIRRNPIYPSRKFKQHHVRNNYFWFTKIQIQKWKQSHIKNYTLMKLTVSKTPPTKQMFNTKVVPHHSSARNDSNLNGLHNYYDRNYYFSTPCNQRILAELFVNVVCFQMNGRTTDMRVSSTFALWSRDPGDNHRIRTRH